MISVFYIDDNCRRCVIRILFLGSRNSYSYEERKKNRCGNLFQPELFVRTVFCKVVEIVLVIVDIFLATLVSLLKLEILSVGLLYIKKHKRMLP